MIFTVDKRTTHQVFQVFRPEPELDTLLQTPTVTIVDKAIVIIHAVTTDLHHTHRHRILTRL